MSVVPGRFPALLLTLALSASPVVVCGGWMPAPEARMACCSEGGACPMHKSDTPDAARSHQVTQAQADQCCASSERDERTPSPMTFAATISPAVLGSAVVLPVRAPALVLSGAWRMSAPVPLTPIPKHVLLSVFLI